MRLQRYSAYVLSGTTLVCALLTLGCDRAEQNEAKLPVIAKLPKFSLTNQHGNTVTAVELRGRVHAVNFMFTSCPTVCPKLTRRMKELQAKTRAIQSKLRFVSITVDPETDTPSQFRQYIRNMDIADSNWWFLTGDALQIRQVVVQGFKQAMGEKRKIADGAYDILHGTHTVLVDKDGNIRGFYASDKTGFDQLYHDLQRLVHEGS